MPTDAGERGRVTVGRVDGAWVAHPLADDAQAADGIAAGGRVELLGDPSRLEANLLVAGCAPLLGLLAGRVGRRYVDGRASWVPSTSGRALDLLEHGLVHAAGVHLADVDAPGGHRPLVERRFSRQTMVIVNLTQWQQGLVVRPGDPLGIRTVQDILRNDVRFVGRPSGSGAQRLVERLLGGARPRAEVVAHGHADVARVVRWGAADVGIAIEAAAIAEGLEFIPLCAERFDVVVPRARLEASPVARFVDLIDQPSFRTEASCLPGYDLSRAGESSVVGSNA